MKTQSNVFFISVMILALITSPISFSEFAFASNHEDDSENITIELEDSISITGENVEPEDTDEEEVDPTINQTTISNLGQEVSNFVHEARDLFKEQKVETKDVIAQCRENMKNVEPSDRQSVREQCKSDLKTIRDSYKDLSFLLFSYQSSLDKESLLLMLLVQHLI